MGTVHLLTRCTSWCTDHQTDVDITWCSRRLSAGRVVVDITAVDRGRATIGAIATSSSHIEDLTPAEAEQLADTLLAAARIARGAR